jgi:hypothetical protein
VELTKTDYAYVLGGLATMKARAKQSRNSQAVGKTVWRLEQLIDHFEMEARRAPDDDDDE